MGREDRCQCLSFPNDLRIVTHRYCKHLPTYYFVLRAVVFIKLADIYRIVSAEHSCLRVVLLNLL